MTALYVYRCNLCPRVKDEMVGIGFLPGEFVFVEDPEGADIHVCEECLSRLARLLMNYHTDRGQGE